LSGAATAIAHPNVALSKYWGKRAGSGRFPAVPSLSVTLSGLSTRTSVVFDGSAAADSLLLNGQPSSFGDLARAVELLDRVRAAAGEVRRARVVSRNDFPTASGLASSASGFAALTLGAVRAAGLDWDASRISDLARRSSASAARSLFGGFVELDAGPVAPTEDDVLSARVVAAESAFPLVILVCVTTAKPKAIGSADGMATTLAMSPYAAAWLAEAPRMHLRLRDALLARDFVSVGELAESSALAMHASAIAAGVIYWTGATLDVLSALRALRASGVAAYATIDAGPHVKVLVRPGDAAQAGQALRAMGGVERIIDAVPGEGARLAQASDQVDESER